MFCFCLNHDADERFRAARADEHASLAGELPLLLRDGRGECIGRHDGILDAAFMRNGDVEQHLRILRADGRPAPLSDAEAAYIVCLGWEMLQPSVVRRLPDGGGQPISGPLLDLDPDTYRINWHRRRAIVTLTILGDAHEIELSILPAPPAEQTPGSPAG